MLFTPVDNGPSNYTHVVFRVIRPLPRSRGAQAPPPRAMVNEGIHTSVNTSPTGSARTIHKRGRRERQTQHLVPVETESHEV